MKDRPPTDGASLRGLRCLLEVAECGSVTAGAIALARTQTAVTKAIQALENVLGQRLLDRHPTGVSPTPAGHSVIRRARAAADELALAARQLPARGHRHGPPNAPILSMNIGDRSAHTFIRAVETVDIGATAQAMGVTPTAVRKTLRTLSGPLPVPLFETGSSGRFQPTAFAATVARHLKMALAEARFVRADLDALGGNLRGTVSIGTVPFVRTAVVPDVLAGFLASNPAVTVRTHEAPYEQLELSLRGGDIDFVVGALHAPSALHDVEALPYIDAPVGIVVRADHPLAHSRRISANDIARHGWIMPPEHAPTRSAFEALLRQAGLQPPPHVHVTSSYALRRGLLMESDMIAVSPLPEFHYELRLGSLVALTPAFDGIDRTHLQGNRASIVVRRRSTMTPSAGRCLDAFLGARQRWSTPPA